MKLPDYAHFRLKVTGQTTIEIEDANDVDFEEVTRCVDCIEWSPGSIDERGKFNPPVCSFVQQPRHATDYCSYGERKKEAEA